MPKHNLDIIKSIFDHEISDMQYNLQMFDEAYSVFMMSIAEMIK